MNLPENGLRGYIQDKGKAMWTAHNNHDIRYFKEEEIREITDNYSTLIGKGAFGEVYKGALGDKSPVAVKRYIKVVKENFAKEVIVHCQVNHRNVVRLIGCCIGENALMMVTEYISRGNLSDILHCSEMPISLDVRLVIATECAEALSYMHSQMYGRIIHGDIKSANILLDENHVAKISDFGISKLLSTDKTLYTTFVIGSIGYMDPLFARTGRLTTKSDVYSFGVVLLELITRRKAVDDLNISLIEIFTQALAKRKKIHDLFDVEIACNNNLRILERIGKLAAKCLEMDIDKRPEMKDVVGHLRMLRKVQHHQTHEKIAFIGWAWRQKQASPVNKEVSQNTLGNQQASQNTFENKQASQNLGNQQVSQSTLQEKQAFKNTNCTCSRLISLKSRSRSRSPLEQVDLEDLFNSGAWCIGKGTHTTYKAVLENGSVLAVKRLKDANVTKDVFEECVKAIGAIEHDLIMPLLGYYFGRDDKLLIYDYVGYSSLSSHLHGKPKIIPWEARATIALFVACAVAYIHSTDEKASHGNIKSSNIFLTRNNEARISEHGVNTYFTPRTLRVGCNIAPEVKVLKTSQKADVYSFGVLLLELLTGVSPCTTYSPAAEPLLMGKDLVGWIMAVPQEQRMTVLDQKLLKNNGVVEEMLQFLQLAAHCCEDSPNSRPVMLEVAQRIEYLRGSNSGEQVVSSEVE